MESLVDTLHGTTLMSKVDLSQGYHQVAVADEDVYKTSMSTRYGNYEWLVMGFGLTNAPATFMACMNEMFSDFMDVFVVAKTVEKQ